VSRIELEDLTMEQFSAIVNGCGGEGLPQPPQFVFEEACARHDLDYWIGATELDRLVADRLFLHRMAAAAWRAGGLRRIPLLWAAWAYYRAVRAFGGAFFYYGPRKRGKADLVGWPPQGGAG